MTRAEQIAASDARREELASLRLQRPLTEEELREEEMLENALALRVWRQLQREEETRLKEAA